MINGKIATSIPTAPMKPFPHLFLFTIAAAADALPVSAAVTGLLLFVAGLSAVISIDYAQRYRGLRLPRRSVKPVPRRNPRVTFHAPPLPAETNQLAA